MAGERFGDAGKAPSSPSMLGSVAPEFAAAHPSPVTRMLSNASAAARLTRPATHDLLCEQKFLGGQSARRTRAAQSEGADSEKWPHQLAPMITAVETEHGTQPGASSRAAERAERVRASTAPSCRPLLPPVAAAPPARPRARARGQAA